MISSHYKNPINYSEEILLQCVSALDRLYNFRDNLDFAIDNCKNSVSENALNFDSYKQRFIDAMNDDLNTAEAIGVIFELVRDVNLNILNSSDTTLSTLKNIKSLLNELTGVLGLLYERGNNSSSEMDEKVKNLIKMREEARKEKNWKRADEIRDELSMIGVVIEDTLQGTKYTFK